MSRLHKINPVQMAVLVVNLDVAVEPVVQGVAVQYGEVVRLAEGVERQLPIACRVVDVASERLLVGEPPRRELVVEPLPQQMVEVDGALRIRVHEQQPVPFLGGQRSQPETGAIDITEVIGLRQADERSRAVVRPRVERAGEPTLRAPLDGLHDGSTVGHALTNALKLPSLSRVARIGNPRSLVVRKDPGSGRSLNSQFRVGSRDFTRQGANVTRVSDAGSPRRSGLDQRCSPRAVSAAVR